MEREIVFRTLGIPETTDIETIQAAYRKNLINVNPEDDPEGFKHLRSAYEEAIRLINQPQESEEDHVPETEIDFWILRVKEVYGKLSTRTDEAAWERLLKEDLCQDLEMEDEVRDALLGFLMDAYRLPQAIWILIEETFQIERNREALYEKFPVNFIDYVIRSIHAPNWLDFTLFEGADDADYDTFIRHLIDMQEAVQQQENGEDKTSEVESLLEQIAQTQIGHPYIDVEKLRYCLACGRKDEARQLGESLKSHESDTNVAYYLSSLAWETENFEEAYDTCMKILEEEPQHFSARMRVYDYYLKTGAYEKARDGYSDLLEISPNYEKLKNAYTEANRHLITLYRENLEKNPDDEKMKAELIWCLLLDASYEDGLKLLETIQIGEDVSRYQYYNLECRLYYFMADFQKAISSLEIFIEEILNAAKDESEPEEKRLEHLNFAYYALAVSHSNINEFDQALTYIDKAIEVSPDENCKRNCLSKKAHTLLKLDRYEACADLCDQLLLEDETFFPAYVYRQEAYYNLRRAQDVIHDFYSAIEIFPGYTKPYILAAKVFYAYRQYEDAKGVIERAHSAELESHALELIALKIKLREANSRQETTEVEAALEQLAQKAKEDLKDLDALSEVLQEQAVANIDLENNKKALKLAEQALAENESDYGLKLKADILYNLQKFTMALDIYQKLEKTDPENDSLKCDIADCFMKLESEKLEMQYYMDALKINPENAMAYYGLMNIYQRRYETDYCLADYEAAISYGKKALELNASAQKYNNLGLLHLDGDRIEDGAEIFETVIEKYPDYVWAYNNLGFAHRILQNYDEACKYLEQAIQLYNTMKEKDPEFEYFTPHWNLAAIYRTTKNHPKAIELYEYLIKQNSHTQWGREKLASVYEDMGEWEQAIAQYEILGLRPTTDYLSDIGMCLIFLGRYKEAKQHLKKAIKHTPQDNASLCVLGDYYWYILGNEKKALYCYYKAVKISVNNEYDEYTSAMHRLLLLMKHMGKGHACKKYKEEIKTWLSKKFGNMEKWLGEYPYRKVRLSYVGTWYYAIGDYKKAKEYVEKMKNTRTCSYCIFCECIELYDLEALLLIEEGQMEKALKIYEKLETIDPTNLHYSYMKREVTQKMKGTKA